MQIVRKLRFGTVALNLSAILLTASLAGAQTVKDVISFTGQSQSGNPVMTPAQGRDGKLYGTSPNPQATSGSDFSLALGGTAKVIHTFSSEGGGVDPFAGLTLGTDGNFYGTTSAGGSAEYGTLYKLSSEGSFTILHNFLGGSDGSSPLSAPIEASDGNFYGTTNGNAGNPPTAYKYTPSGTFTTIYQFDSAHGVQVQAGLIQGSDGNLYGTAIEGGVNNNGTLFKLSTSGTLLYYYAFPGGSGGALPFGGLTEASDGNIYGTTEEGGMTPGPGFGTVFKMDRTGNISILYSFDPFTGDAVYPVAGLVQGTDGYLYGVLLYGGTNNFGGLFRISTTGSYRQLYSFSSAIGQSAVAALFQDTNGLFYGSAEYGGAYGFGAVYSLNMGLGPFVTFVSRTGKVGQSAQILGQGLTGTTRVTFNGKAATKFSVVNDTYMTAVVPTGATTGRVVVTTPTGKLTSNVSFRIFK